MIAQWNLVSANSSKQETTRKMQRGFTFFRLWVLLVSSTSISLLMREGSFNIFSAMIFQVLSLTGLLLERLSTVPKLTFLVFIVQSMFLFGTLALIACAHTANSDIDINMWNFLWIAEEEKNHAFGTLLNRQNTMKFLLPIQSCALGILFLLFGFAKILSKIKSCSEILHKCLQKYLCGTFFVALISLLYFALDIRRDQSQTKFSSSPPPVKFTTSPDILIFVLDSWRADLFDKTSMPQTLQWLSQGKNGSSVIQWENHDASAVYSDQGEAAIFYSLQGMSDKLLKAFINNPNITS